MKLPHWKSYCFWMKQMKKSMIIFCNIWCYYCNRLTRKTKENTNNSPVIMCCISAHSKGDSAPNVRQWRPRWEPADIQLGVLDEAPTNTLFVLEETPCCACWRSCLWKTDSSLRSRSTKGCRCWWAQGEHNAWWQHLQSTVTELVNVTKKKKSRLLGNVYSITFLYLFLLAFPFLSRCSCLLKR